MYVISETSELQLSQCLFTYCHLDSTIETCCWRLSCCQRHAALGTCLSSSKTSRSSQSRASALWDTQFISPDMWPANSHDLNPVDYCIWGVMQKRVHQIPIRDTHELHSLVDHAINEWHKRLEACINADGVHFEHLSWHCLTDIQVATKHNWLLSQLTVPHDATPLFRATNVWRKTIYLPSDEWILHFTWQCGDIFQVWWASSQSRLQFVLVWDNANNEKYIWIILLKNDFLWISQGKVATVYRWRW